MNAKISVFVICVEIIIDMLLFNLHDCTFKAKTLLTSIIVNEHTEKLKRKLW